MIYLFRATLPADIYRKMLREYFDLQRILEGLTKGKEKFAVLRKDEDVTQLILALSIFYRHVITQFEGAGRVMERLRASDIGVVQMGTSKLDGEVAKQMDIAIRQFYGLMAEFRIPKEVFLEHDIKKYAKLLTDYLKTQT